MLFTGCTSLTGKKATTTTTTPTTTTATQALQDRIAAAESRIAGLESGANSTKVDVDSLLDRLTVLEGQSGGVDNSAEIADLQDQIDALTDEIDALEGLDSSTDSSTPSDNEAIRWRFESPTFYDRRGDIITGLVGEWREDTRIKEEDIYYVTLWIYNDGAPLADTQFYVEWTLKPSSSSDYALLSNATYLDTDDTVSVYGAVMPNHIPEPSWDASFDTKTREGVETTKKVEFESSMISTTLMPTDTSGSTDYIYLELVLELYYAD